MRNYDFLLILAGIFVTRIIFFSSSYSDAICLIAILAYATSREFLSYKKISNELEDKINKNEELSSIKMQELALEVTKIKNGNEAIKAAVNFNKR